MYTHRQGERGLEPSSVELALVSSSDNTFFYFLLISFTPMFLRNGTLERVFKEIISQRCLYCSILEWIQIRKNAFLYIHDPLFTIDDLQSDPRLKSSEKFLEYKRVNFKTTPNEFLESPREGKKRMDKAHGSS